MQQPRPGLGLGFMIAVCFSIDLARQSHMSYKAEQLVLIKKFEKQSGIDLRKLSFEEKTQVLANLGINLFVRDF